MDADVTTTYVTWCVRRSRVVRTPRCWR